MSDTRKCEHCKEYEIPVTDSVPEPPLTRDEFERMAVEVREIHTFVKALAEALNSPMLKAMLPPQVRGMLGG